MLKCGDYAQDLTLVTRKDTDKMKTSKMKRIKTALLAVICSATAVLGPIGPALAQEYTTQAEIQTTDGQDSGNGNQAADGQAVDDSNQAPDGQNPENGNGDSGSQTAGDSSQAPDGQTPGDSNQTPDDDNQSSAGDEPDQPDNPDDSKIPDEDKKEPDVPKIKEKVKLTSTIKLAKNGKSAQIKWKKTGNGEITDYYIQRSSSQKGKFKTVARKKAGSRVYTDARVTRGNKYFYRVAAKTKSKNTYYSKAHSFKCPLETVSGINLVRYSTSSIKVQWNKSKNKKADWYKVYYAESKSGKYKLAGKTKNTWYRVKNLKNNQDYYFGVKACTSKKNIGFDSKLSNTARMKTMPFERTTIFAGDSITSGLTSYNILNEIAIGGHKSVVAAVGLNTMTFRTRRVFNGMSGVESIVASKPYRVYIMLGDNDIHYRNKNDLIAGYREIIRVIQAGTPGTDIVLLAASPVTAAEVSKRSGFAQIPAYNQGLSALAKEMGVKYYDCTGFLKDSTGWLKNSYNAGDGVHWQPAAYHEYAKYLTAYDKSLD